MSDFKKCPQCKHPAVELMYGMACTNAWCRDYKEYAWKELRDKKAKERAESDTHPGFYIPDWSEKPEKCLLCGRENCSDSTCF